jgi:hypothetical protein
LSILIPYHTGFVVSDIAAAAAELQREIGYEFNVPTTLSIPRFEDRLSGVDAPVTLTAAYSRTGPHRLELLQAQGDGVYSAARSGWHHIGVWESDMVRRVRVLEESDAAVEAIVWREDGGASAVYARTVSGARGEYVNADRRDQLERWFDTGVFT